MLSGRHCSFFFRIFPHRRLLSSQCTAAPVGPSMTEIRARAEKLCVEFAMRGVDTPAELSDQDCAELARTESYHGIRAQLEFFARRQQLKVKRILAKKERYEVADEFLKNERLCISSRYSDRNYFMRIHGNYFRSFHKQVYAQKLAHRYLGNSTLALPRLCIDFGYGWKQSIKLQSKIMKQALHIVGTNYSGTETPFDLSFVEMPDLFYNKLVEIHNVKQDSILVSHTMEKLGEVHDTKDCVYLSPDSPNLLKTVDTNKVYVLGGIFGTDKFTRFGSINKANSLRIPTARLPIKYSNQAESSILNHVTVYRLLREYFIHCDWVKANDAVFRAGEARSPDDDEITRRMVLDFNYREVF